MTPKESAWSTGGTLAPAPMRAMKRSPAGSRSHIARCWRRTTGLMISEIFSDRAEEVVTLPVVRDELVLVVQQEGPDVVLVEGHGEARDADRSCEREQTDHRLRPDLDDAVDPLAAGLRIELGD